MDAKTQDAQRPGAQTHGTTQAGAKAPPSPVDSGRVGANGPAAGGLSAGDQSAGDQSAWHRARGAGSLTDVHRSVAVRQGPLWRRATAFLGPGYLVAVGYMDPGNWATSLAGGSRYGYALLCVTLLSSLMAMLLQSLCSRLAVATGRDLAQACWDAYPRPVAVGLWGLAELAICATDLAEVIGTAIGLQLLFGLPLAVGVLVTALDVFLVLALQRLGFRYVEAFVIALLGVIAASFAVQIAMARPDWADLFAGFVPTTKVVTDPGMLYLALGILGATVMPHNLYLHSGIVQTRAWGETLPEKREAIRFANFDSSIALAFALIINAAILVLAAATFHAHGKTDIAELGDAHALLMPLLGAAVAPSLFAVALIACGLNSTVTATMAGQIVMEGFLEMRLPPWLRRLVTRLIAIVPAAAITVIYGESGAGKLLIFSQVVLSLQLPFAMVPLVMFTLSRRKMGELVAPKLTGALAILISAMIIALNVKLVIDYAMG